MIGNEGGRGVIGNKGNISVGKVKAQSGRRSGIKRSSKYALIVKQRWLDQILAGKKTWEIRGCATKRRGWIHFAASKSGGKLLGRALLTKCVQIPNEDFASHFRKHRVADVSEVPYSRIYAWVLSKAQRFKKPFAFTQKQGQVIWAAM